MPDGLQACEQQSRAFKLPCAGICVVIAQICCCMHLKRQSTDQQQAAMNAMQHLTQRQRYYAHAAASAVPAAPAGAIPPVTSTEHTLKYECAIMRVHPPAATPGAAGHRMNSNNRPSHTQHLPHMHVHPLVPSDSPHSHKLQATAKCLGSVATTAALGWRWHCCRDSCSFVHYTLPATDRTLLSCNKPVTIHPSTAEAPETHKR